MFFIRQSVLLLYNSGWYQLIFSWHHRAACPELVSGSQSVHLPDQILSFGVISYLARDIARGNRKLQWCTVAFYPVCLIGSEASLRNFGGTVVLFSLFSKKIEAVNCSSAGRHTLFYTLRSVKMSNHIYELGCIATMNPETSGQLCHLFHPALKRGTFTPCSLVGNVQSTLQVCCTILSSEQYILTCLDQLVLLLSLLL